MRSPSCRSLYDPRLMPHSKPSRTSVTSSLNRRRPAISTFSATTTPLRVIRALVPRLISPLRTIEPAMLPNLLERKISRISGAELHLLVLRLEHALQGCLDLLDGLVDHRVVADLDALALGVHSVLALGPDVVADDDGVRRHREVDVVHRDRADATVDDAQVDLLAHVDLEQGVLERLDRTRHITLEDEVEGVDLAGRESLVEVLEADALAGLGQGGLTVGSLAPLGDLARGAVVRGDDEGVAGPRDRGQTKHLDRAGRAGLADVLAVLVEHGTDAAVGAAGDDGVADPQGAGLHQHRRGRTAATVEVGLDGHAASVAVGVGAQVERRVGREQDGLEEAVDVLAGLRGDVDEHGVAAVLLGHEVVLGQLLAHLRGVGALEGDLVDRDHDRHIRRLGVVERLDGLRHHAVVSGDDEDRDVGDLGTTGTHGGERLVARGVDEGDRAVDALVHLVDLVVSFVVAAATGLTAGDILVADGVEQAGLSVVDVAHDGHDRRTRLEVLVLLALDARLQVDVEGVEELLLLLLGGDDLDVVAELGAEQLEGVLVQRLRGRGHLAEVEEHRHECARVGVDLVG